MPFHIHSRHSMVIPMKNVAEWYFSTFLGMMGMGLEWWFQSFEAHSHHSHHSYHSKFQGHSGFHSFHFGLIPSFGAHSNSFEKQKTMAICRNEKGMRDWSGMVNGFPISQLLHHLLNDSHRLQIAILASSVSWVSSSARVTRAKFQQGLGVS